MSSVEQSWPGEPRADPSLQWLLGGPNPKSPWDRFIVRVWRMAARRRLAAAGFLVLLITCIASSAPLSRQAPASHRSGRTSNLALPPPHIDAPFAPTALRALTPADAVAWNASTPLALAANPAARAFVAPLANATDYQRSLQCLTMAIYYEAGNEPVDGERAVAQVVLNRVRHVAYPKTICGVVFEGALRRTGCQFTFACDGSMARVPATAGWRRASLVASAALSGYVYGPVGLATHYHADYIVPYWASSLDKVAIIGAHIFYRWSGVWGQGRAFARAYAGSEPALPGFFAIEARARGDGSDAAPLDVTAQERPVLISDAKLRADAKADAGPEVAERKARAMASAKAVGLEDRWIVPHHSVDTALVEPSTRTRDIMLNQRQPAN